MGRKYLYFQRIFFMITGLCFWLIIFTAFDIFSGICPKLSQDGNTKEKHTVIDEHAQVHALRPLLPNLVPTVVHFIWCSREIFTFNPYMSVMSAFRLLQTDVVILHYEHTPLIDRNHYHLWLDDLKNEFPHFVMRRMDEKIARVCGKSLKDQRDVIVGMLSEEGGMYLGMNTWILDMPATRFDVDLEVALEPDSIQGYVILRRGIAEKDQSHHGLVQMLTEAPNKYRFRNGRCRKVQDFLTDTSDPACLILEGMPYEEIYPKDIMTRHDKFGSIARTIFYGNSDMLTPQPSFDTLVPNIGHLVWFGTKDIDFLFYLDVLSLLFVLEVEKVFIHGDFEPRGDYWIKLKNNTKVNPKLVYMQQPKLNILYQNEYNPKPVTLLSDFSRAIILNKYGGFYCDKDVIWTKPFTKKERTYDTVMSFDWARWFPPFPAAINNGVFYTKRNAPFWQHYLDKMRKKYEVKNPIYQAILLTYKVWERYPQTLHLDAHLQAMCFRAKCHPTWMKDFQNQSLHHINSGSLNNWREDVHAFHFTNPNPPEYANESTLISAKGIFADVGKMVLLKAGLLHV